MRFWEHEAPEDVARRVTLAVAGETVVTPGRQLTE